MHERELASKEEDHVNSLKRRTDDHTTALAELQNKLLAVEEDRERLRQELVDAQQKALKSSQSLAGAVTDVDIKALHAAHEAKLGEVEREYTAKIEELNQVVARLEHEVQLYRADE